MELKREIVALSLGLALVLGAHTSVPQRAHAQDASAETVKRKVRTRVPPEYPVLAKQMKVTGKVKIETTISPEGRVTGTKVVGGSPLLVGAALDAVKKWRFEPGPKETSEIIEFEFSGNN